MVYLRLCVIVSVHCTNDDTPTLLLAYHPAMKLIPVSNPNASSTVASGLQQAAGCDFIYDQHLIYWLEVPEYGKVCIEGTCFILYLHLVFIWYLQFCN